MTDPQTTESLGETPGVLSGDMSDAVLQPTGSGIADLEIAFEQMKLAEAAATPGGAGDAEAESVAHPS